MRIFDKDGKVNFVDKNNVYVGYDMTQDCCEDADWFITPTRRTATEDNGDWTQDVEPYSFDVDFFEEVTGSRELDAGGMVRFRLVDINGRELFLHIYNAHNGYYGHGFEFMNDGAMIHEGNL